MDTLPKDIMVQLLCYLPWRDAISLSAVNRTVRRDVQAMGVLCTRTEYRRTLDVTDTEPSPLLQGWRSRFIVEGRGLRLTLQALRVLKEDDPASWLVHTHESLRGIRTPAHSLTFHRGYIWTLDMMWMATVGCSAPDLRHLNIRSLPALYNPDNGYSVLPFSPSFFLYNMLHQIRHPIVLTMSGASNYIDEDEGPPLGESDMLTCLGAMREAIRDCTSSAFTTQALFDSSTLLLGLVLSASRVPLLRLDLAQYVFCGGEGGSDISELCGYLETSCPLLRSIRLRYIRFLYPEDMALLFSTMARMPGLRRFEGAYLVSNVLPLQDPLRLLLAKPTGWDRLSTNLIHYSAFPYPLQSFAPLATRHLCSLSIHGASLNHDSILPMLAAMKAGQYQNLNSLDMSCNNLDNSAVCAIAEVLETPGCPWTVLRLASNVITHASMPALAHALAANLRLRRLDLADNFIACGFVSLMNGVSQGRLRKLNVASNQICLTANMFHEVCLRALVGNPRLARLDFRCNRMLSPMTEPLPRVQVLV